MAGSVHLDTHTHTHTHTHLYELLFCTGTPHPCTQNVFPLYVYLTLGACAGKVKVCGLFVFLSAMNDHRVGKFNITTVRYDMLCDP